MQTKLEVKGISKRITDTLTNSTKIYGIKDNEVKGNSSLEGDEYDINGSDAKKGGETQGSLVNHLNQGFDITTGGDSFETKEREKQQNYVIPGLITYSAENFYSDADNIKVDTSGNIGQVVIF